MNHTNLYEDIKQYVTNIIIIVNKPSFKSGKMTRRGTIGA